MVQNSILRCRLKAAFPGNRNAAFMRQRDGPPGTLFHTAGLFVPLFHLERKTVPPKLFSWRMSFRW